MDAKLKKCQKKGKGRGGGRGGGRGRGRGSSKFKNWRGRGRGRRGRELDACRGFGLQHGRERQMHHIGEDKIDPLKLFVGNIRCYSKTATCRT